MSKTLDLKKIKLGKNSVELVYLDFVQSGEDTYMKEVKEICHAPATAEFKTAVKRMENFVRGVVPFDEKKVEKLVVTQISITDEDDGLGIVMSVTAKFKKSSRPLNFNTPYWSTLDNENPLPEAAVEAVDTIKEQAKAYSRGLYEQASLDLGDAKKEPEDEDSEETALDEKEVIVSGTGNLDAQGALDKLKEEAGMNGDTPKPRRKRRTKLEMEKARAEKEEAAATV